MKTWFKTAAISAAAVGAVIAAPASATIFEYEMTNGDILTIDTDNGSGTWKGNGIDTEFTGDFSGFTGGATPSFMFTLDTLTGTRLIRGELQEATNTRGNRTHPFMLKTKNGGEKVNLWSWWGDPVVGGDYIRKIAHFRVVPPTEVPAPGALGLFGLALVALGFGRRRRIKNAAV